MTFSNFDQFQNHFTFDCNNSLDSDGAASVFKATSNQQLVALKRKHSILAKEKYSLFQEFITAKTLKHPNLIEHYNTYRFEIPSGILDYGVMEYANGGNLYQFLKNNTITNEQKNEILIGVLHGLQCLHEQDVVYGKLHPANILIHQVEGQLIPKLIGYGKSIDAKNNQSILEHQRYAIAFLSPDQIQQKNWNVTTDIWAFGVLAYWLFSGDMIFGSRRKEASIAKISRAILTANLPTQLIQIPEPYQTIIVDCLQTEEKEKLKSADELIWRLERNDFLLEEGVDEACFEFVENEPLEIIPNTKNRDKVIVQKKNRKILAVILAASCVLFCGLFFSSTTNDGTQVFPEPALATISNDPTMTTVVAGQAAIRFDEVYYDFGYVEEHMHHNHTFRFTNIGDAPLTIKQTVNSNRNISIPNSKNWVALAPGKSGEIVVALQHRNKYVKNRTIEVYTNASPDPVILTVDYKLIQEAWIEGEYVEEGDKVNIRNSPSLDGDLLYQMEEGEQLYVLEQDSYEYLEKFDADIWYKIRTAKGDGWIFAALVTITN